MADALALLRDGGRFLLDIVLPPTCLGCDTPVDQPGLANVDTPVMQPLMRCGGVRTGQADAGLYAGGNALVGPQQRDRRRPAGWGDRDPPATQLGKGHVKLLLHTQRLGIELKCAVLVGDRNTDRRDRGDERLRCVHRVLQFLGFRCRRHDDD